MEPREPSYLGAAIFWSYILAALVFSSTAVHSIITTKPPAVKEQTTRKSDAGNKTKHKRSTRLLTFLALLSFTTLSANMLHVLIHSFTTWTTYHPQLPPSTPKTLPALIWSWSTTTPLFHAFATAILASPARRLWTLAELCLALYTTLFMSIQGRKHRVPRLYAFFALSQILPVSFAQNMFYLALLRRGGGGGGGRGRGGETGTGTGLREVRLDGKWVTGCILAYGVCVFFAPGFVGGEGLMPVVLVTRLVLLAPRFLPTRSHDAWAWRQRRSGGWGMMLLLAISAVLVGWQVLLVLQEGNLAISILWALFSHPAVSALGCDFVIGLVSLTAWYQIREDPVDEHEKAW